MLRIISSDFLLFGLIRALHILIVLLVAWTSTRIAMKMGTALRKETSYLTGGKLMSFLFESGDALVYKLKSKSIKHGVDTVYPHTSPSYPLGLWEVLGLGRAASF